MKPRRLTFCGINCFDTKQTIDFDLVAKNGIFGIFGPTGSGKSTILDAITLALFGEIARSRGKGDFVSTKCKTASVEFLFESKKEYLVKRCYTIKKSGLVDSTAELWCGENLIAEGARAVDIAIAKVTGLSMADFSKCVALPQGEFAAFLKAKQAERTVLVGNLFGLEIYGDDLTRRANSKKEILSQQLTGLENQISKLGQNLEEEIEQISLELTHTKEKIEKTEKEVEEKREKLATQEKEKIVFEKHQKLLKEKQDLDKKKLEIENKKSKVLLNKKVLDSENSIRRHIFLSKTILDLEIEIESEMSQFVMAQNKMRDILQKQKENQKKQETLPNSEEILMQLVALSERLQNARETKKEIENAKEKIAQIKSETEKCSFEKNKTEISLSKLNEKIEKLENNINDLEIQITKLSSGESQSAHEAKLEILQNVLKKLQYHYDQIDQLNSMRMNDIANRNKVCAKNQEKAHEMLTNIGFDDDFVTIERQLEKQIDQMQHAKEHIDLLEEQINSLRQTINSYEAENTFTAAEIQNFESKKATLEQSKSQLKEKLKALETERDNALLDEAEKTVSSETVIGVGCPICGNIVQHVFPPKNTEISNINSAILLVKKQIEHIDGEIAQNQIKRAKHEQKIKSREDLKLEKQKEIKIFENSIQKILISFVDLGAKARENFEKKLEELCFRLESLDRIREKINFLQNHSEDLKKQNTIVGNSLVKDQEVLETLFEYIQQIQKTLAERQLEKLSLSTEDLEKNKDVREKLVAQNSENKKYLEICAKERLELVAFLSTQNAKLESYEKQVEDLKLAVLPKEQQIAELDKLATELSRGFESVEDRIEKTRSAKQAIESESRELAKELAEQTMLFESLKMKKMKTEQQIESEKEELAHLDIVVQKLLKDCSAKNCEQLLEFAKEDSGSLQLEIDEFEKKNAFFERSIAEFEGQNEQNFDETLEGSLKIQTKELANLQTQLGVLVEKLKNKNEDLQNRKNLEKEKQIVEKDFNNFSQLCGLLRGKELLAFAAEEYLQEICSIASNKLFELLDGRYSLVYKDKDFFVQDHFDDGKLRQTSTLSGGETFVVSLALALSIAESILRLSDKKIDFFFLDEGFGTLDQELRETIVSSLLKLRSGGITIGLISHMQELKNDITSRLVVKRTLLQDGSSKSSIVMEQDI